MASNKDFNLSSHNKAKKLIARFGKHKFDYMGDHNRDIPVWEALNLAILVNTSEKLIKKNQSSKYLGFINSSDSVLLLL